MFHVTDSKDLKISSNKRHSEVSLLHEMGNFGKTVAGLARVKKTNVVPVDEG